MKELLVKVLYSLNSIGILAKMFTIENRII